MLSQNSDFDNYLIKFQHIALPFHYGYTDSLIKSIRKVAPLSNHDILQYIALADSIPSYLPYQYYPFGRFTVPGNRVVAIYIIKGGAGGIEMYFEMALYDLVSKALIDRMLLSAITGDFGRIAYSEGVIDSQFYIQQNCLYYERDGTTYDTKLVSNTRNRFRIANKGFEVIEGEESLPIKLFK